MTKVVLVTVQPRNATTGAATTIRLAGGGNNKPYLYGGNSYRAGVAALPRLRAEIGFDDSGWNGNIVPQTGTITWAPYGKAGLSELAAYYWKNAAITVQTGEEATGIFTTLLTGKVADATVLDHKLVITIADLSEDLTKPLLTARFAGTGAAEGGTEAKNRIKRRTWGRAFNIEGRVLDKANNIYEFGDPSFPWQSFETLRDKARDAAPAPTVVAWAGSVAATLAALVASAPAQGSGCVAPSIACAKWWTQPAGPLTADVKGEVGAGYVETAASIAARILTAAGGPAVTNTATADGWRAGVVGIHVDENETISQALDRLLLGVSLIWKLDPAGTVTIREFTFTGPVEALRSENVERLRTIKPIKTRRLGYQRAYRVHSDGEIAAVIQVADAAAGLVNTSITVNQDGTLNNAGGGQVTANGLGVANGAGTTLSLVCQDGTCPLNTGNAITKTSGNGSWLERIYSREGQRGSGIWQFKLVAHTGSVGIYGVTEVQARVPPADGYPGIIGVFIQGGNACQPWDSTGYMAGSSSSTNVANDIHTIVYNGGYLMVFQGPTLRGSKFVGVDKTYYFAACPNTTAGGAFDIIMGSAADMSLTIAGSGRLLGDMRNVPANISVALLPALVDRPTISDTWTGSSITLNVGSATVTRDDGGTTSYGSGSILGQALNTLYYIYRIVSSGDPTNTGTGWGASTTLAGATGAGKVLMQSFTTRATSGAPSPPSPPAGQKPCTAVDMWLEDADGGFRLAAAAATGGGLSILDYGTMNSVQPGSIASVEFSNVDCVRLVTASGGAGVWSVFTPLQLEDGTSIPITEGLGRTIFVGDRRSGRLEHRWEEISRVEPVGLRRVAHIHAGGATYAAGEDPSVMLYTHNPAKP